jgi:hypothetical protein
LDDQLLILRQATSFDNNVRAEVSRLVVYMDPGPQHLAAVLPACNSWWPPAHVTCVYVAMRMQGPEADHVLIDAVLKHGPSAGGVAAAALSTRKLERQDAAQIEAVFDGKPGSSWSLALTSLCASIDADTAARIKDRIDAAGAVDASLLFHRLYGDPTRMGECTLSQRDPNPVPARCNACAKN